MPHTVYIFHQRRGPDTIKLFPCAPHEWRSKLLDNSNFRLKYGLNNIITEPRLVGGEMGKCIGLVLSCGKDLWDCPLGVFLERTFAGDGPAVLMRFGVGFLAGTASDFHYILGEKCTLCRMGKTKIS